MNKVPTAAHEKQRQKSPGSFAVLADHGLTENFKTHRRIISAGSIVQFRLFSLPGLSLLRPILFGIKCWWVSAVHPTDGPIVTAGSAHGFVFAFLQWLFSPVKSRRTHVMVDLLLEHPRTGLVGLFERMKMRLFARAVDAAAIWGATDPETYAVAYGLPMEKLAFVPYHITTEKYTFDIGDDGYIFTGGNFGRDFKTFIEAVSTIDFPVFIATQTELEQATEWAKPFPHITVKAVTPQEFRQKIARCSIFAEAHPTDFFRTAGHQTMLNAMWMGKPVVMADKRSAIGYIEDGVDGLVVEAGDVEGMRSALKQLVDDIELRRKMSRAAQDKVKQPFYTTLNCMQRIYNLALKVHFERKGIKLEEDLIQMY